MNNTNTWPVVVIFLVFILQTVLTTVWWQLALLNIPLVILVYYFLNRYERRLWWLVLVAGFLFDLYSQMPFGTYVIIFSIVIWLTMTVNSTFFTNQSVYTYMVSIFFALIFFTIFKNIVAVVMTTSFFASFNNYLVLIVYGLVVNLLLGLIYFSWQRRYYV